MRDLPSVPPCFGSLAAAERADDGINNSRRQYDRGHSDQARLHRGFSHFKLMRTPASCRVLHGTYHERDDAYRDRDIADISREVVEQRVDASVHRTSDVNWRAALSTSLRRQRGKG